MNKKPSAYHHWLKILTAVFAVLFTLSGCGNDGSDGAAGPPGPGVASKTDATALNITITDVTINSAPVVTFKVTNQDNTLVTGLLASDLYFTIAKLIPGANGTPSSWQNYINIASRQGLPYIRGNRENNGTLVDNQNGTYTYTFSTDITDTTKTCPALAQATPVPCEDAYGNTLDTSYNSSLTHRVAIQTRGSLPVTAGVYTFKPGSGAVASGREIVTSDKCNQCHNKLEAHDERSNTQYCVLCHNPGTTAKGTDGTVTGPTPVDFKVMIHKIHDADALPSVAAGGDYGIYGYSGLTSFKEIAFPQDIRNCTKCHDGTVGAPNATAQGDNWKNMPNKAACSSCHDDVYFGTLPDPTKAYQTVSHITQAANFTPSVTVGPDPTDDMCVQCHGVGQVADVSVLHTIPSKVARSNFKFNIKKICGVDVAANGTANTAAVAACQPGGFPTVTFSVTDPNGGTHGYANSTYNIFTDPEFADATSTPSVPVAASGVSLTVDIAWNTLDYTNTGGSQARPGRANQFSVFGSTVTTPPYGQAMLGINTFPYTQLPATDNGDGTFTLTAATPIPASATGSGAIALEGRAYNSIADPAKSGSSAHRTPIKAEVAYFGITDTTPKARRVAVDAVTKCDNCHDQLSLHGGNRNDNVQLCVLCHNPGNTDAQASARPKDPTSVDLPIITAASLDGKKEESIDLKRMIHGIHAGAKKSLDGTTTLEGFREKGLWIAGGDFSGTRFPGILNDCSTCHVGTSYQLTGTWETPLQNGIHGSTTDATPGMVAGVSTQAQVDAALNDPTDDLKITPTAAVCSSCHDSTLAQTHMVTIGGAVFNGTATAITSSYETCAVCHGPGRAADVAVVHSVP